MTSFESLFGDSFSSRPTYPRPDKPSEKAVQIRGREIDGAFYVRAEDVVALLVANSMLPNTVRRLKKALER